MTARDTTMETSPTPFEHATVMRDEVVSAIVPRAGGRYVDVTLGGGGHAEAILDGSSPDGRLAGIDRDPRAREAAAARLARFGDRVTVHAGTMRRVREIVRDAGFAQVDGLVADLGVSSPQLDDAARGMSFRAEGPLDMRMSDEGTTAWELVRDLREKDLADVIYRYGEERASRPIARTIKERIDRGEMETTIDLAKAVYRVLGPPRPGRGIDPATRTFQAIRIAVNDELGELEALLDALPDVLADDACATVISFHSLEDRLVKFAFRGSETLEAVVRKPLVASETECASNPRARSAKLRIARRIPRENAVHG